MVRYLWTHKEDIGPSPRTGHAMTHDPSRSRTVLFGGDALAGALLNDTWEWNGEFWTQMADIGPEPRRDHTLCFDAARNAPLLFGGTSGHGPLGDTWSWNGEDWTQLEDSGPSARSGHAMAFDSVRGRAVLFGGESAAGPLNDTWEWDGQSWIQQEDTGPSPRKHHALGFDLVRSRIVLFGGDPGIGSALGDTWSWDGANWTQTSNFGANPCLRAAMVSTDVQISMFGGLNSANATPAPMVFHETWVFDGKRWTHRQDIGPGPRWGHAMAYDSARRSIVLFGGLPSFNIVPALLLGDTWEHTETDPAPVPPPTPVGPNVIAITLSPTSAAPGAQVTASITLDASSLTDTQVFLGWLEKTVFDQKMASVTLVADDVTFLPMVTCPAGSQTISTNFFVPASAQLAITILAGGVPPAGGQVDATMAII